MIDAEHLKNFLRGAPRPPDLPTWGDELKGRLLRANGDYAEVLASSLREVGRPVPARKVKR